MLWRLAAGWTRWFYWIFWRINLGTKLIVAHFDHGIRDESHLDAEFVAGLAKKYGLPFVLKREELGPDASEEKARDQRYAFLRSVAKKYRRKVALRRIMLTTLLSQLLSICRVVPVGGGWQFWPRTCFAH
jgi:hypothetical protein